MSALGFILRDMGYELSGSDKEENSITEKLKKRGVKFFVGHDKSYIGGSNLIVYSSSIRMDNPEIMEAKKKGISVIPRIKLLDMVAKNFKKIIAVTGTHGKTTTTAMSALVTEMAGFDPTVLIGGESFYFSGNAKLGKSDMLVTEMDESDGKFIILKPTHIVMPNLEMEHLEYYKDEKHLLGVFKEFLMSQSKTTKFFYKVEDDNLRSLASVFKGKTLSFGFVDAADVRAANVKIENSRVDFDCFFNGKLLERFTIGIPGMHNVINATAVISLSLELGVNPGLIKTALSEYKGVKRRFELVGIASGIKIVEDYAHHPTEIKATIAAARSLNPGRLVTVFQPHRYTRTRSFYKDFANSFYGSDELILTDVYAASEDKIEWPGVKDIYDIIKDAGHIPVKLLKKDKITDYLSASLRTGDFVLVLAAGDINKLAGELLERLNNERKGVSKSGAPSV